MPFTDVRQQLQGVDLCKLPLDLLVEIDELIAMEEANPYAVYWAGGMSPGQRAFHEDRHHNRLLRAANKVGKTTALSLEAWGFLTGTHPHNNYWQIPTPCTILYVVRDIERNYSEDVCRNLREFEPRGLLHPDCSYDDVRGYMVRGKQGILMANGSRVFFRSGRHDPTSIEGIWAHVCMGNEPMTRAHWGGFTRTAAQTNAPLIVAFTSVGLDLSWQRKIIELDPETAILWGQTVLTLTKGNVPWRPQEWLDAQIANVAPWERDQRIFAAWEGVATGRAYDAFSMGLVTSILPSEDVSVVLGFDHGERPGHEAVLLAVRWRDKNKRPHAYVLDEYISPGATTPETDAMNVEKMLQKHGISLMAVKAAVGDVNSAGKSAAGQSLNSVFERAFADLVDSRMPPFRITKPRKRPGSVLAGTKSLNFAMADGRCTFHPRVKQLIKSLSQWQGTNLGSDKAYTHTLDGLRYVLAEYMDTSKADGVAPIEAW